MDYRAIYTDFFDTLMFRHVHPFQVIERWARLLADKLDCGISEVMIYNWRMSHRSGQVAKMYSSLYEKLISASTLKLSEQDFHAVCLALECAAEIGCQYPNKSFLKWLRNQKESGVKIFIVSDFYLSKKELAVFLQARSIELSLFDDIFVSSDFNATKREGTLYDKVTEITGIDPAEVLMIGDNRESDIVMARRHGFHTRFRPNYLQHLKAKIKRTLGYDYSRRAFSLIRRDAVKYNSPFTEYSLVFYLAVRQLYVELESHRQNWVAFLSREGHFLQRAFIAYQNICIPESKIINTQYIKSSRRASRSLDDEQLNELLKKKISIAEYLKSLGFGLADIERLKSEFNIRDNSTQEVEIENNPEFRRIIADERFSRIIADKKSENQRAFSLYFSQFVHDSCINLVDIGWNGSMQDYLCQGRDVKDYGYYLGINIGKRGLDRRKGLIFTHCNSQKKYSKYSDLFRSNIQLYELLAAAPHGSALGYGFGDDRETPVVFEEWAENEKHLYETLIQSSQKELLLLIEGISAWCGSISYDKALRKCAFMVLRAALISNDERLDFLKALDKGFFWNEGKERAGITYDVKEVAVGKDIIYAPERYARFFAKLERYFEKRNPKLLNLYRPFSYLLYGYIRSIVSIKSLFKK